jgi:hypothetical protein
MGTLLFCLLQFIIENWGECPNMFFFGDKLTVKIITGLRNEKFSTKVLTFSCRSVLEWVATKSKGKEVYAGGPPGERAGGPLFLILQVMGLRVSVSRLGLC